MSAVIFRLSEVEPRTRSRPEACPYCDSRLLQGWGWETKLIEDVQFDRVTVHRYRCEGCGRTFRHYPSGIDHADQSLRIREAAALLWGLGLNLNAVVTILGVVGIRMSTSSIWRASQPIDRDLRKRLSSCFLPVIGCNPAWMINAFEPFGMVVILILDTDRRIGVGITEASRSELNALAETLGIEVSFDPTFSP